MRETDAVRQLRACKSLVSRVQSDFINLDIADQIALRNLAHLVDEGWQPDTLVRLERQADLPDDGVFILLTYITAISPTLRRTRPQLQDWLDTVRQQKQS